MKSKFQFKMKMKPDFKMKTKMNFKMKMNPKMKMKMKNQIQNELQNEPQHVRHMSYTYELQAGIQSVFLNHNNKYNADDFKNIVEKAYIDYCKIYIKKPSFSKYTIIESVKKILICRYNFQNSIPTNKITAKTSIEESINRIMYKLYGGIK